MADESFFTEYDSENDVIGTLVLTSDGESITGLLMSDQRFLNEHFEHLGIAGESQREDGLAVFASARKWLDAYFSGEAPDTASLPLDPKGSKFRMRVWEILSDIPYGEVVTYGDIAERIAREDGRGKMSAQAVGGAVGHNPIGIIVPCHRVVGANGNLTGYGGGIQRKIELLRLEGLDVDSFSLPKGCVADCASCGRHR